MTDSISGAANAASSTIVVERCYYCEAEPPHVCQYAPDELTPEQRAKAFMAFVEGSPCPDMVQIAAALVEAFKAAAKTERFIVYDEQGVIYGRGARQLRDLVFGHTADAPEAPSK